MNELIKESYKIRITDKGIIPISPSNYEVHANNGSCFKIYIVKNKAEFLYVGMAKQKIRARFSGSFRAHTKKKENGKAEYGGYSGYKWIEQFQVSGTEIELLVFPFINELTEKDKKFIEAVEAEIVFLIRSTPPYKWPLSQNEIHFHNNDNAKKVAQSIFDVIK